MVDEKLKFALEMRGMTQKELANKAGLTEVSICRYVNGDRAPNAKTIIKICKALNISADWLLGLM